MNTHSASRGIMYTAPPETTDESEADTKGVEPAAADD